VKIEIQEGTASTVGGHAVGLTEVRVTTFATHEGALEARRTADLSLDDDAIMVEEGSQILIGGTPWVVVRIRRRNGRGLVRLRGIHDTGRFGLALERFHDRGSRFDLNMTFLVEGARTVHDLIRRVDDHPDTVGTFANPLTRAHQLVHFARRELSDAGASAGLLAYADRHLELCTSLLKTVRTSTQETELED
jgi:hypothetical protein